MAVLTADDYLCQTTGHSGMEHQVCAHKICSLHALSTLDFPRRAPALQFAQLHRGTVSIVV